MLCANFSCLPLLLIQSPLSLAFSVSLSLKLCSKCTACTTDLANWTVNWTNWTDQLDSQYQVPPMVFL